MFVLGLDSWLLYIKSTKHLSQQTDVESTSSSLMLGSRTLALTHKMEWMQGERFNKYERVSFWRCERENQTTDRQTGIRTERQSIEFSCAISSGSFIKVHTRWRKPLLKISFLVARQAGGKCTHTLLRLTQTASVYTSTWGKIDKKGRKTSPILTNQERVSQHLIRKAVKNISAKFKQP